MLVRLVIPLGVGGGLALKILPTLLFSILNPEICKCCGDCGVDMHLHLPLPMSLVLLHSEVINCSIVILDGHMQVCVVLLYDSCHGALSSNLVDEQSHRIFDSLNVVDMALICWCLAALALELLCS